MKNNDKPAGNPQVNVRLPPEVGDKLAKDAKKLKTTTQAVILSILAEHYDVDIAAPQRGRPKNVETE